MIAQPAVATSAAGWQPEWQPSLFGLDDPVLDASFAGLRRHQLDAELVARVPWRQRHVPMYGRLLDEPRLTWWWSVPDGPQHAVEPMPLPVLDEARLLLSQHYSCRFDSVGVNLYRNGTDSVAWHGDKVGPHVLDPVVAIVSVGAPRPFLLRPVGGGPSLSFLPGQGDLLVMGGAAQLSWQHAVPKVAAAGPRISIVYRHDSAGPDAASRRDHQSRHPSRGR
jgi:alkylated DNA repair dioxygenase AlkB